MIKTNTEQQSDEVKSPARVLLVGVGGMGINALQHFTSSAGDYPNRVAIDTDGAALNASSAERRVQIGSHLTDGMSTGGDVDLGRRSANADFVKLRELFVDVEQVVLLTGLGGGVGSGAAPVIAETARDEGAFVISVATLPFPFEGDERVREAEKALEKLRRASQAVITMPNQYLLQDADEELAVTESFRKADEQVGAGFKIIWRLLAQHNLINLDFQSLKHMLQSAGGVCTFVYAEGGGKSKAKLALSRVMSHPAIKDENVLDQADGLLVALLGSPDLTLVDVQEIMHGISAAVHSNARRFVGVGIDHTMKNRLGLLLLIGGKADEARPEPEPEEKKPARKLITPVSTEPARKTARVVQKQLELPPPNVSKGRFKDVEPTLRDGEDLDLPTFIRRGMKLR